MENQKNALNLILIQEFERAEAQRLFYPTSGKTFKRKKPRPFCPDGPVTELRGREKELSERLDRLIDSQKKMKETLSEILNKDIF
jgi:hypothetical protein